MRDLENEHIYNLTETEIRSQIAENKIKYKVAKENFEFEYASMMLDDIRVLQNELKKRTKE